MAKLVNPNVYNEEAFLGASAQLDDAVLAMWEAGASEDDIVEEVKNAIKNQDEA